MRPFATTAGVIVALLPAVLGLTINEPVNLVQCQITNVTWTSGIGPYVVTVMQNGEADKSLSPPGGIVDDFISVKTVHVAAGTDVVLAIHDLTTNITALSSPITVQSSSDSSCLDASTVVTPTTSSSDSSFASGTTAAGQSTTSQSTAATTTGETSVTSTTATSAASSTTAEATTSGATTTSDASSTASGKRTPVGAIAGGVVGGLLLLGVGFLAVFFLVRRSRGRKGRWNNGGSSSDHPDTRMGIDESFATSPEPAAPSSSSQMLIRDNSFVTLFPPSESVNSGSSNQIIDSQSILANSAVTLPPPSESTARASSSSTQIIDSQSLLAMKHQQTLAAQRPVFHADSGVRLTAEPMGEEPQIDVPPSYTAL